MLLLSTLLLWTSLSAQKHNGIIYHELLDSLLINHQQSCRGATDSLIFEYSFPDTICSLIVEDVSCLYKRLEDGQFERRIEILYMTQTPVKEHTSIGYVDTLNRKAIREIVQVSPKPIKGENPSRLRKYLIPIATIGGSIMGIVSLFYIRSR